MAESNTTRLALRQWSAGTDTPSRSEFNDSFASLELLTAIDKQDVFASRPAAGVRGTYFWDTTNNYLWRDNGSAWHNVGSRVQDSTVKSSVVGNVPLTVDGVSGQTANLLDLKVNAVTKAFFDKDGNLSAGTYTGKSIALVNATAATAVISGKGAASQSAALFELKNSADVSMASVSPTGVTTTPYALLSGASVLNGNSASVVANHLVWSGAPQLEIKASGSGTFNDFVYLKHGPADAAVAVRRLGILMKVGNEDATGAAQSTALYMRSGGAAFDAPSFRIDVRDVNVWDMRPDSFGSSTPYSVISNGSYFRSYHGSGTGGLAMHNTWLGTQNGGYGMYLRSGATNHGIYGYAGGTHNDTLGDAGGGQTLFAFTPTTAAGMLKTGRLTLTEVVDAAKDTVDPTFMIGHPVGQNLIMDYDEILARDTGAGGVLQIQHESDCELRLGLAHNTSKVYINDRGFYVSTGTTPLSPAVNDVWLHVSVGQGLKLWNGSSWVKI